MATSSQRPIYWECTIDGHNKFWGAQIFEEKISSGPKGDIRGYEQFTLIRKWGAIGTQGQSMEQTFSNMYDAESALDKLIYEKESKGYKPIF